MPLKQYNIDGIKLKRNYLKDLPYNPKLKILAREKRKAGYLPEVVFWQQVHKGKFHSIDFDRQRVIGNYIVDFYVKALGVVIEIDGSSHDGSEEQDEIRENYLKSFGIKVYRIRNDEILHNTERVMLALADYLVREFGESPPL